jgi:D-hydroxyproline dehydrogenase subunit beta
VEDRILQAMLERAWSYVPSLRPLALQRTWTGIRGATRDKLPLIGPDPAQPHRFFATGHEGLGIVTALATAELIAHHIAGSSTTLNAVPYLPGRLLR